MRIRLVLSLLIPVCLVGVAGCGSSDNSTGSGASSTPTTAPSGALAGTAWTLQSYRGASVSTVPAAPGSVAALAFASDGSVAGSTGCNQLRGTYDQRDQQLTIQLGPMTQAACGGPLLEAQETAILQSLPQVASFTVTDDSLTLSSTDGTALLVYAAGLSGLENTTWNVTGVNNGAGGVEATALTERLTATFGPSGAFTAFGGCNNFTGAYTIGANQSLSLGDLAGTTKSCGADVDTLESQYAAALSQVTSYTISGDVLTLRDTEGATQVTLRLAA